MRQKIFTIDPVNVDANGIAEAQTLLAAGALTLDGALIIAGVFVADYPRQIAIISSGNDSGITFTVTGTDHAGAELIEAITGGNTATVESSGYFATITSIVGSGAAAANVTVGTVDELLGFICPLNRYNHNPATVSIEAVTGTLDVSVEQSFSDIQDPDNIVWQAAAAGLTNASAAVIADLDNHATGVRLIFNSYTNGADIRVSILEDRR